jgi:predicted RNA-binding protein YlqC (UPF0109 family)
MGAVRRRSVVSDELDTSEDTVDEGPTADLTTAKTVLTYVVSQLVEDPSAVEVDLDERGRKPVLNVHVGPGDMGRVIGKRGRVAQSIRTVVRAAAARDGGDVEVEFLD